MLLGERGKPVQDKVKYEVSLTDGKKVCRYDVWAQHELDAIAVAQTEALRQGEGVHFVGIKTFI